MPHELNHCSNCFEIAFDACAATFIIPIGVDTGAVVHWTITDKFGNRFIGSSITDADGSIEIATFDFPAGLFTPFSGSFRFTISAIDADPSFIKCEPIPFTICETEFTCVSFTFANTFRIEPPTPPDDPCFCIWAFGVPDVNVGVDPFNVVTVKIGAAITVFNSSGNLLSVDYEIRRYENEIESGVMQSGSIAPNMNTFVLYSGVRFALSIVTTSVFDDGAIIEAHHLYSFDVSTGVTVRAFTNISSIDGSFTDDCENVEIDVKARMQSDLIKTTNFAFFDANGLQIETGLNYDGVVLFPDIIAEPNITWNFGIVLPEWPDLPQLTTMDAGVRFTFDGCPV